MKIFNDNSLNHQDKIIVKDDAIRVLLTDGNQFELPRLTVDGRGKKVLPFSDIYSSSETEDIGGKLHHHICFYCSEHKDGLQGAKELVKTEDYTILLYA